MVCDIEDKTEWVEDKTLKNQMLVADDSNKGSDLSNTSIAKEGSDFNEIALPETIDKAFIFGVELLDKSIDQTHKHTISSYMQITAIAVLDIAYVFAYGGLRGTAHYVFDTSASATGKDSAAEKSYQLYLKPVMELQSKAKEAYAYECESSDEKLPSKSFHCIHTADATAQGTYRGFETTKAQYPRLGEVGNKMKNKEHPLMNFITDCYGKTTLIQPNYKKDLDTNGDLMAEGISLFFYGNSNIPMMGMNTFLHHLQGGLLNRCVLIHNTYQRSYEERPHDYDLPYEIVKEANTAAHQLISFAKKYSGMAKPTLPRTKAYADFDKSVFDQMNEMSNSGIQDMLKRTMQNLNGVIYTLHYLICGQDNQWGAEIAETTIETGVQYMRYIIDNYSTLIDEVVGATQEVRDESNTDKLQDKIKSLSIAGETKILHRDLYRALHLNRTDYDALIENLNYKIDHKFLYTHPVTV